MSPLPDPLRRAHRLGRLVGLALCFGTPGLITSLILSGIVPGGTQVPEGPVLQLGQAFTGLVFLATAFVVWRRGTVLAGFGRLAPEARPAVVLREAILYASLFEASCLFGLAYWLLVGSQAGRHVAGFIGLTPMLCLAFTPSLARWREAAGAA